MRQSFAVVLCATGLLAAAYTVDPPTTAPSDTIQDCTSWDVVSSSDTCQSIADFGFITLDQLYAYVCQSLEAIADSARSVFIHNTKLIHLTESISS